MTVVQRRHGQPITIWPVEAVTDRRGNVQWHPNEANAITTKAWIFPQRSSKAEVPGQQDVNMIVVGINALLPGVQMWSRVIFMGKSWDVVGQPSYHHGTRHTRHWSLTLRERP